MHLITLCEEPSAEAALNVLLARLLAPPHTFQVVNLLCKTQLLAQLPDRLRTYARRLRYETDLRVLVLLDRDQSNCQQLKQQLEDIARQAGLRTLTTARPGVGQAPVRPFHVVNRLACEELEAWFFGDPRAVMQAYPNTKLRHFNYLHLRAPDAIAGGTWEALERTLRRGRYYPAGLAKIQAARAIAPWLDLAPGVNQSPSFQAFVAGVQAF